MVSATNAAPALKALGMDNQPCWSASAMSNRVIPCVAVFANQSKSLSSHVVTVPTISASTEASSRPLRRGTRKL